MSADRLRSAFIAGYHAVAQKQFVVVVHHENDSTEYRLDARSAEQVGRIAIGKSRNAGFNPEFAEVWTACGSTMLATVDA